MIVSSGTCQQANAQASARTNLPIVAAVLCRSQMLLQHYTAAAEAQLLTSREGSQSSEAEFEVRPMCQPKNASSHKNASTYSKQLQLFLLATREPDVQLTQCQQQLDCMQQSQLLLLLLQYKWTSLHSCAIILALLSQFVPLSSQHRCMAARVKRRHAGVRAQGQWQVTADEAKID